MRLFVHHGRTIFVSKARKIANRPKLLTIVCSGSDVRIWKPALDEWGLITVRPGTIPIRTRTKTRYRLVREELHGEEGSGVGRRKTWIAYCLCSVSDAKMTIDRWSFVIPARAPDHPVDHLLTWFILSGCPKFPRWLPPLWPTRRLRFLPTR